MARRALLIACGVTALTIGAVAPANAGGIHRPGFKVTKAAANIRIDKLARAIEVERDRRSPCTVLRCDAAGEIERCSLTTRTSKVWVCRGVVGHYVTYNESEDETTYRYLIFVRYATSRTTTLLVTHKLLSVDRTG